MKLMQLPIVPMARSPNDSAFLAHIVSQLENQVDFLVKHRYISQEDASTFLAKLPSSNTLAHPSMPTFPTPTPQNAVFSSAHAPTPPPPPPSSVPQARVLWAWAGQVQSQSDQIYLSRLTPNRTLETSVLHKARLLRSYKRTIQIGGLDELLVAKGYFLRAT